MASKQPSLNHSESSDSSHRSLPSEKLLSSVISLPPEPCIAYAVFIPLRKDPLHCRNSIELARRQIFTRNKSLPLLQSCLSVVHISQDPALYVFSITSQDCLTQTLSTLNALRFDGLLASETSSFAANGIYPCSSACSSQRSPCPACLHHRSTTQIPSTSAKSIDCLLPRQPLRHILAHFLEALRDRLIYDLSVSSKNHPNARPVTRLKGGFLLDQHPAPYEWCVGWEHHASAKPIVYCHLDITLTPSRIIVRPILRHTDFLPLSNSPPLSPGSPITLIPYATPAYFLGVYLGPSSALTTEFDSSLAGIGVGEWKTLLNQFPASEDTDCTTSRGPSYVIAWISVENKHGDEKGVILIWPMRLCLSFLPSSSSEHARSSLSCIPGLPPQLQSSPTFPDASTHSPTSDHGIVTSSEQPLRFPISRPSYRPPVDISSWALRTLMLSKAKGINNVVTEVHAYVDAIAKERERERERIRRERENANSSQSPHAVIATTTGATPVMISEITQNDSSSSETANDLAQTTLFPSTTPLVAATSGQQHPSQLFYPSPPQSNLPHTALPSNTQTSPAVTVTPVPEIPEIAPLQPTSSPPDDLQASSSTPFDPFGDFDASWQPQPNNDFMDMGIDFGMGLGMDMDPIASGGGGRSTDYDRGGMDYEDAFTDDDFSFFDRPTQVASAPSTTPLDNIHMTSVLTTLADPTSLRGFPPLFEERTNLSVPVPPEFTTSQLLPSPWGCGPPSDLLASRFEDSDTILPEVLLPPPGQTTWSHSVPASPNVQLSYEYDHPERRRPNITKGPNVFDPIPFASCHRVADGKYVIGKFALPSPPDEEDQQEPPPVPSSGSPDHGWRSRYNAVTDPRVGVVRKLLGVKRKILHQDPTDTKVVRPRTGEQENWIEIVIDDDMDRAGADSDEGDAEEIDGPIISRPSTPPPFHIPLGPTLLHTKFKHCELAPLSVCLKPPGAAVAIASILSPPALTSVPTPVSPAAIMGAIAEKSKSLEATASMMAREVVENGVWFGAWKTNPLASSWAKTVSDIWQADVRAVNNLLESMPSLEGPLDLPSLFQFDSPSATSASELGTSIQPLESPMISVGKADAIIHVLPSALRFWDKLGLVPRGGKKDVTAFVFFEEGEERQRQAEIWLGCISSTYSGKNLGRHTAGSCNACPKDGLVPTRFEAFRKHLLTFIRSLPTPQDNLVFYIVLPVNSMTLASPLLRQVLAAAKRVTKTYPESQILFQLIPSCVTVGSLENPPRHNGDHEVTCLSVYNRILQPVERLMSRQFLELGGKTRDYIQELAFSLARPVHNNVKLLWESPVCSLDVMDRHTLLHVGYQVTSCGKWILAVCVDQRGEAHDLGVWLTQSGSNEAYIVTQVWGLAIQFARKANVEWRLAIAKLGTMGSGELDAWMAHLEASVSGSRDLPMIHVSVLSVEPDEQWTRVVPMARPANPRRMSSKDRPGSIFVDGSASTYLHFHTTRLTLSSTTPCFHQFGAEPSFVSDTDPSNCENLGILAPSTTTLISVPEDKGNTFLSMLHIHLLHTVKSQNSSLTVSDKETHTDITKNYHELAVLAQCRWNLEKCPLLPFHLVAVDAMHQVLELSPE